MARTATAEEAVRAVVASALEADPALTVIRETPAEGLPPDRVTVVPIADRAAVGLGLGVALAGQRALVELSGAERLPAVLEVLAEAGALAAGDEFAVPLVVRVPYGGPLLEPRTPGASAAALTATVPGVWVVCPSTPALAAGLASWALQARRPVVILEPAALAEARGEVDPEAVPGREGPRAGLVRRGTHATVAAWGAGVAAAVQAAEALSQEGIDVDVIDLVSLAPIDRVTLGQRVRATGRLVVAHPEDPWIAARVREVALEEAFLYLEAPLADATVPRGGGEPIAAAVRRAVHY
ncbi:MAG: transketolase C-terminal domain-containing protein [Myxococcota bacterium]